MRDPPPRFYYVRISADLVRLGENPKTGALHEVTGKEMTEWEWEWTVTPRKLNTKPP